jgi:hypothetical protein
MLAWVVDKSVTLTPYDYNVDFVTTDFQISNSGKSDTRIVRNLTNIIEQTSLVTFWVHVAMKITMFLKYSYQYIKAQVDASDLCHLDNHA